MSPCIDFWGLNNITVKNRYPLPPLPLLFKLLLKLLVFLEVLMLLLPDVAVAQDRYIYHNGSSLFLVKQSFSLVSHHKLVRLDVIVPQDLCNGYSQSLWEVSPIFP